MSLFVDAVHVCVSVAMFMQMTRDESSCRSGTAVEARKRREITYQEERKRGYSLRTGNRIR